MPKSGDAADPAGLAFRPAESGADVAACFPLMVALRPHLASAEELVTRVVRQRAAGYRILVAWRAAAPVGLAGYRISENLIYGPFVYVDDLVTAESERGGGIGARLLDAVAEVARRRDADQPFLAAERPQALRHPPVRSGAMTWP